ncbi:hypothetical protein [Dictyobacter arantiisoli]|uniref:hypothetical protein n=1 Tax=Dictyobacter arantiisoli TaxID=2014874 RepID=UPI0011EEAA3B|nr:hypothetical protein [Dictyobacter arantiisoli]
MKDKCQHLGHEWTVTASRGWFSCRRIVDNKVTKRNPIGQSVYCNAVSYCPGCLGYRLDRYEVVMCRDHSCMNIQLLPLMLATPRATYASSTGEQKSLW